MLSRVIAKNIGHVFSRHSIYKSFIHQKLVAHKNTQYLWWLWWWWWSGIILACSLTIVQSKIQFMQSKVRNCAVAYKNQKLKTQLWNYRESLHNIWPLNFSMFRCSIERPTCSLQSMPCRGILAARQTQTVQGNTKSLAVGMVLRGISNRRTERNGEV